MYYDAAYHSDSLSLNGNITYASKVSATSTSATLSEDDATISGFEYKEGESGNILTVAATNGTATVTGLNDDTEYYYRTYTTGDSGTDYGVWQPFRTPKQCTVTVTDGAYIGTNEATTMLTGDVGDSITVTAPLSDGEIFYEWVDGDENTKSEDRVYQFILTADISLTPTYETMMAGTGTENNPYQIAGEEDLVRISDLSSTGRSFSDIYFVMTDDITMTSTFSPIGTSYTLPFEGSFDGNGKTISGLQIADTSHAGLFGYLDSATIKNLTISGASIDITSSDTYTYAGGIAAYITNETLIMGCTVANSTVTGQYAGNIVGGASNSSMIRLCNAKDSSTNGRYAGGIIGESSYCEPIVNCEVSGGTQGTQTSTSYGGGIAGQSSSDIKNCRVDCDVVSKGIAGGIAGYIQQGANITHCEYNGIVTASGTGEPKAGGIVGYYYGYDESIKNCVAYGEVNATTTSTYYTSYAGGIAGSTQNVSIENCVAMQDLIDASAANSLVGNNRGKTSYESCYAASFLSLTSSAITTSGITAETKEASEMDETFWTNLAFTTVNGWILQEDNKNTQAAVEAHRMAAETFTLTVSGDAVPYYLGEALTANVDGTYSVVAGMTVTMKPPEGDAISEMAVNGMSISESPWSFVVNGDAQVTITIATAKSAIWVYDGDYIIGQYDNGSAYTDIDWTNATDSSETPISGTYDNMDMYVFCSNYGDRLTIDQLDLGNGSIYLYPSDSSDSYAGAEFYRCTYNSYLNAESIESDDSNQDDVSYYLDLNVSVSVNTIAGFDSIECWSGGTTITIGNDLNINILDIYNGSEFHILGDLDCSDYAKVSGDSVLTVSGTLSSDSYLKLYNNAKATILGDIEITSGNYGVWMEDDSDLSVSGSVSTNLFYMKEQTTAEVHGNVTVKNQDNGQGTGTKLYDSAAMDVSGEVSSPDYVKLYSVNTVLLNAAANSTTPIYDDDTSDIYYRTTLSGMPKNTRMEFDVGGGTDMSFTTYTDENGKLVAWMRSSGDTVTATTTDGTVYSGSDTVGNENETILMKLPSDVTEVTLSSDVVSEQAAGAKVSYSNTTVTSDDLDYFCNSSLVAISMLDDSGQTVDVDNELSEGLYYLTFTYVDKNEGGNLIAYGTITYPIEVKNQYTISFDSNGGSTVSEITALDGKTITLPSATRSGYTLSGWSDGTNTYSADSSYAVTRDTTLKASWKAGSSSSSGSSHHSSSSSSSSDSAGESTNDFYSVNAGQNRTVVTIDSNKILSAATNGATLGIDGGTAQTGEFLLTAGTLNGLAQKDVILQMKSDGIYYNLPTDSINMDAIKSAMGARDDTLDEIEMNITITELMDDSAQFVKNVIANKGYTLILQPIEFTINATYGGKSMEVSSFSSYVTREIPIPSSVEPSQITTAVVVSDDGTEHHVPTKIVRGSDGSYFARIHSLTNSVYALVGNNVEFADAEGTWYEDTVSEMASRMIITGREDNTFDGSASITRAEFAVILTRALGLSEDGTADFSDVSNSAWYYGAVGKAAEYGLITGREDGSFDANAKITRQEAMVMIQRAAEVADYVGTASRVNVTGLEDISQVSSWAEDAVSFNVSNGLIVGSDNQLRPTDTITRAECATVVLRLLKNTSLI
ncbi:S-layer homology domain-containing protein [Anaerovorax odorimutans]|uniref:S-layer homology domain-containing protein n=1 Tax=Anaerovorax odorimutans TaxID=109327 RepID=UPI001A99ADDE|nr:S-layer homology domain-containing protein [Anaerovorax odorimutans]